MMTENLTIRPAKRLRGSLVLPGDKSISHRALLIAALARGDSELRGLQPGEDCRSTLNAIKNLGVRVTEEPGVTRVFGT